MKKNTLAVFDSDEEYVTKLMSYMSDRRSVPLEIQGFTDKDRLKEYIKGNDVDILLIPEGDLDEDIEAYDTGEMMVLSENDSSDDGKGHKVICKYQSSENIMREIMVNGTDNIFVEKAGRLFRWDKTFESREALNDVIQQIAAGSNRVVNEASPIVDARLENGSRVNIVMNPIALNGPVITIRRFPDHPIRMEDLIRFGSITAEAVEFLRKLVISGYNIFVSGGTGSGKTTFLNALSSFIPEETRVITIEDSAELQIQGIPNLVSLETRNANVEGCLPITIRDLIKSSLRMRPDRIIVGEIRDGAAFDFLQAANTGQDGDPSYQRSYLYSLLTLWRRTNSEKPGETARLYVPNT